MGDRKRAESSASPEKKAALLKTATRIEGLDDILHGGLPTGRITLVAGGPGTGKSMVGLEFIYRGARSDAPGIFISFEETAESIRQNTRSFGWDLPALEKAGLLFLVEGIPDPGGLVAGGLILKGFWRSSKARPRQLGAERIVLDALDVLLRFFKDPGDEQQQITTLERWIKKQGLTTILTSKNSGPTKSISPYDYLDYMADCVIYLDQRVQNQVNTKRLQVVKYRGSGYGSNEYPFLITARGISFNPISDMALNYESSTRRISSGIASLDRILGGGYRQGSSILVAGESGTGKTSLAATFAQCACRNGRKVLYVNYEESQDAMLAGMRSIGLDLRPAIQDALLRIMPVMPESMGIEEHLYHKTQAVKEFQPHHLVMDSISACKRIAGERASFDFIMRLIYFCRKRGVTVIVTNQVKPGEAYELTGIGVSSLIDTIVILRYRDVGNETRRLLQVRKSRGSGHSNRYHRFLLSDQGIQIVDRPCQETDKTGDCF